MTNTVNSEATKIDIISGFLGAGKTTLIKKLLAGPLKGQQVVLIENEFGEIGIDGGFMQEAGIEVREMNSGCICCSLVGDFGRALKEVIDTYHPDRIVIEPSGVGKLSDVIKAVQDLNDDTVMLNSFTTVADVNKVKMYMENFGEFYSNQLQFARTIVLSRTDTAKATEERIEEICGIIRGLNPNAMIITTPVEKLDGAVVMEALEKGRTDESELMEEVKAEVARHHHHHHHHEDGEECCCGHHHDHEHHHHHDDEEECCCHDHEHHHHHHDDDEECCCHDHEHHHHHHDDDEECCCGHHHDHEHHHHHDDEECCCHDHEHHHRHHDDDEECCCHDHEHHHHHHDDDEECSCGHHHHHHHEDGEECCCGHHHDHDADEVFTSWGTETAKKYSKEEIESILKTLTDDESFGIVLRAKGMVDGKDGEWVYFDMVPEEFEVRTGGPQVTGRYCVIGSNLNEEKLSELFNK